MVGFPVVNPAPGGTEPAMSEPAKNGSPESRNSATPPEAHVGVSESARTVETPSPASEHARHDGGQKRFCGKPGRSGPPKGNRNNMRHGLRAGQLPADAKYIECRMNAFRREVEDAVIVSKGEINLVDAASIQTAMKWERHGALALRWLTKEADKLSPSERLQFSREVARASTERDKALSALQLDAKKPLDLRSYVETMPESEHYPDPDDKNEELRDK